MGTKVWTAVAYNRTVAIALASIWYKRRVAAPHFATIGKLGRWRIRCRMGVRGRGRQFYAGCAYLRCAGRSVFTRGNKIHAAVGSSLAVAVTLIKQGGCNAAEARSPSPTLSKTSKKTCLLPFVLTWQSRLTSYGEKQPRAAQLSSAGMPIGVFPPAEDVDGLGTVVVLVVGAAVVSSVPSGMAA